MDYIKYIRKDVGHKKIILNASSVIIVKDDMILLQKRKDNQKWGLIGGILELNETYEEAAIREAKEETGLDISLDYFLGIYHNYNMVWVNNDKAHVIGAFYVSYLNNDLTPRIDEESIELRFFHSDELPPLFAEDHRAAIKAYLDGVKYPLLKENKGDLR